MKYEIYEWKLSDQQLIHKFYLSAWSTLAIIWIKDAGFFLTGFLISCQDTREKWQQNRNRIRWNWSITGCPYPQCSHITAAKNIAFSNPFIYGNIKIGWWNHWGFSNSSEKNLDISTACQRLKSPHSLSGTSAHPAMVTLVNIMVMNGWLTSFSFHVNRPSHSWDKAISDSDLETPRSRSWVWPKGKVTQSA